MGGLAAVFYAVQMLSGIYRNQRDFHNTAYGGMAAGALLGLSCEQLEPLMLDAPALCGPRASGSLAGPCVGACLLPFAPFHRAIGSYSHQRPWAALLRAVKGCNRPRRAVLGAALGTCIGVPAGLLQDKVSALLACLLGRLPWLACLVLLMGCFRPLHVPEKLD